MAVAIVQLAAAGTAGLLVYLPIAVRREQLRQFRAVLRRGRPVEAPAG